MRVNVAIPEEHVTAPVLDSALEAVTRLNEALLAGGHVPTFAQAQDQVTWKPEPPGAEHFDHAGIVHQRGHGDCDDLAPWHAASHRHTGRDKGARAIVVPSGPQRWHAVVKMSDGTIEDPSLAAGMGGSRHRISGAALPFMCGPTSSVSGSYTMRPQLALRPTPTGWQGRTDLPWHWRGEGSGPPNPSEIAMVTLHQHPVASTAIVGSIDGALELAEANGAGDPEHLERLCCLRDYAAGMPLHELAGEYGHEHAAAAHNVIGSFWSHLAKMAVSPFTAPVHAVQHLARGDFKGALHDMTAPIHEAAHMMKPFTPLMRFIPGIGPVAATAVDLADRGIPHSWSDFAKFAAQQGAGFIPGVGPIASRLVEHGIPTSFGGLANFAAQEGMRHVPGLGTVMQSPWGQAAQMIPGGGGGFARVFR